MAEDNYTVKEMVTELRREVKAQSSALTELRVLQEKTFEQATKTSGRLAKAEQRIDDQARQINTWKAYITVFGSIVTLFGLPTIIRAMQELL